ncbi:MAG: HEAT repeat domain-containing protein [Candidatus Methylomirabilis oxyfera]|nr:HEAT repeat domain-containing protein [Candidatus Methylomirabilis oxyfera]
MGHRVRKRLLGLVGPCNRLLLALLIFMTLVALSAPTQAELKVEWQKGRLSVVAERMPLVRVFREVAGRTGLRVSGAETLVDQVTVRLSDLDLRTALRRLLNGVNYVLVERGDGVNDSPNDTLLIVVGPGQGRPGPVDPGWLASSGPDADKVVVTGELEQLIIRQGPAAGSGLWDAALAGEDSNIRALALETLAQFNPSEGLEALRAVARNEDSLVRVTALQVLSSRPGDTALPVLAEALNDPDIQVKGYALAVLLQERPAGFIQALDRVWSDPDPDFRYFAVQAVGQTPGTEAEDYLKSALRDEDERVRNEATEQLRRREEG